MFFTANGTDCCPDWGITCSDFDCRSPIEDAILTSLLTEAQDPTCKTGGWWCDPQKGSRLHLIKTTNLTQAMAEMEDAAKKALNWLVGTGAAEEINVTTEYDGSGCVQLCVEVFGPNSCAFRLAGQQTGFGWIFNANNI